MDDLSSTPGASAGTNGTATDPGLHELMRMADALLEQAAAVRQECAALIEVLDSATAEVAPQAAGQPEPRAVPAGAEAVYGELPEGVVPDPSVAALGMALDGSDRAETREFLVTTFGLEDPEPILDEVYPEVDRGRRRLFRRS